MKSPKLLFLFAVLGAWGPAGELRSAGAPNAVLITGDDLGWGDVGFNGGNRHEIHSSDGGKTFAHYDLIEDPGESKDLSSEKPEIHQAMFKLVSDRRESCRSSDAGEDYR